MNVTKQIASWKLAALVGLNPELVFLRSTHFLSPPSLWVWKNIGFGKEERPLLDTELDCLMRVCLLKLDGVKRTAWAVELRKIVSMEATEEMNDIDSGLTCDLYFYEASFNQKLDAYLMVHGVEEPG